MALDLDTGKQLWQISTGDKLLSSSISTLEVRFLLHFSHLNTYIQSENWFASYLHTAVCAHA